MNSRGVRIRFHSGFAGKLKTNLAVLLVRRRLAINIVLTSAHIQKVWSPRPQPRARRPATVAYPQYVHIEMCVFVRLQHRAGHNTHTYCFVFVPPKVEWGKAWVACTVRHHLVLCKRRARTPLRWVRVCVCVYRLRTYPIDQIQFNNPVAKDMVCQFMRRRLAKTTYIYVYCIYRAMHTQSLLTPGIDNNAAVNDNDDDTTTSRTMACGRQNITGMFRIAYVSVL